MKEENKMYIDEEKSKGEAVLSEEAAFEEEPMSIIGKNSHVFVNAKEKYEDASSSAVTLLIVGIAGVLILLANITGITNKFYTLPFDASTQWLFYTVMMSLFIFFIVLGIYYVKKAKFYKNKIYTEETENADIEKWLEENINSDTVKISDKDIEEENLTEEEIYFKRFDCIKEKLYAEFPNVDKDMIDDIIDKKYDSLFDDKPEAPEEK